MFLIIEMPVDAVDGRRDLRMLVEHASHIDFVARRSRSQSGPDHVVLGRVMMMQRSDHELHVVSDDACTGSITSRHSRDQAGHVLKLAAKDTVNDHHVRRIARHRS